MFAEIILSTALFAFSTIAVLLGVFAISVGAGRTKRVGLALSALGLLGLGLWIGTTFDLLPGAPITWTSDEAFVGLLALLGGLGGLLLGLALFLGGVVRG